MTALHCQLASRTQLWHCEASRVPPKAESARFAQSPSRRRTHAMGVFVLLTAWVATAAVDLTEHTFDQHVGKRLHSLVEFHAPWCTACADFAPALHPAVQELIRERPDLQFMRVDGDSHPELRTRFRIEDAPSILLFQAGAPADRATAAYFMGQLNQLELTEWARGALSSLPLLSQPSQASSAKPSRPAKPATPATQRVPGTARAAEYHAGAAEYHAAELLRLLLRREGKLRDVEKQLVPLLQQRVALTVSGEAGAAPDAQVCGCEGHPGRRAVRVVRAEGRGREAWLGGPCPLSASPTAADSLLPAPCRRRRRRRRPCVRCRRQPSWLSL